MLADVKREVDFMVRAPSKPSWLTILLLILQKILRGHPNIVYLIDAACNRMPTGGV
jgi:hypothetical protein